MAADNERNPLEYCPVHPKEKLLMVKDRELLMYFSIGDKTMFCCPLLECDYVRTGIYDRILSHTEFVQMIIFARQKAFQFKYNRYHIGDGK
ncbi:MAG: hypothetical protein U1A25_01085 [Candidatus Sungbacteria bacterium]|nr:hypothetical protein [bacterium]MDZ4260233.1 hypothetical protein [Candidatus Sungbacteria bacterium]